MHKLHAKMPSRTGFLQDRELDEIMRAADPEGTGVVNTEQVVNLLSTVLGHKVDASELQGLGVEVLTLDTLKMTIEDFHTKYPGWQLGGKLMNWLKINQSDGSSAQPELSDEALMRLFAIMDKDGSGELSLWELLNFLKVGGMLSLYRVIMCSGAAMDGKITPDEFKEMMRKLGQDHPEMKISKRVNGFLTKMGSTGSPSPAPSDGAAPAPAPSPSPSPSPAAPPGKPVDVQNKKALLVGINYIGQRSELGGCINDVRNEMDILKSQYGFEEENIMLLTEDQGDDSKLPTTDNIRGGFRWLFDGAAPGDLLFFAYSGHGSQMPDPTGTEPDGKNECICPLDCNSAAWPQHIILDNEINDVFVKGLPDGVRCVCIFDCCHSATTADLTIMRDSGLEVSDIRSRFLDPPEDVQEQLGNLEDSFYTSRSIADRNEEQPSKLLWVFSGCQDDQTSADAMINGKRQGALTWGLLESLSDRNFTARYGELLDSTKQRLRGKYTQVPALSTTSEQHFSEYYLAKSS